jgi:hypothetical protein
MKVFHCNILYLSLAQGSYKYSRDYLYPPLVAIVRFVSLCLTGDNCGLLFKKLPRLDSVIHPQRFRDGECKDDMFSYLLSYTKLQTPKITRLRMGEVAIEIIPHHRDYLNTLSMRSNFENGWCYGPHTLWQCSSLRDV